MQSQEGALTLVGKPGFLNVVIGGVEVRGDVLCVYVCHCHLQMLKPLRRLQILWVVVNADDPAALFAVNACPGKSMNTQFSVTCNGSVTCNESFTCMARCKMPCFASKVKQGVNTMDARMHVHPRSLLPACADLAHMLRHDPYGLQS